MASITKYSVDSIDTSLLNQSDSQYQSRDSNSKVITNYDFLFCLQSVINKLDKTQNVAISSVGNYLENTSSSNIDSLLNQINAVNKSLKDVLLIRTQIMHAYQSSGSLSI